MPVVQLDGRAAVVWEQELVRPSGRSVGMRRFVQHFWCKPSDPSLWGSELERAATLDTEMAELAYAYTRTQFSADHPPPQFSAAQKRELKGYADKQYIAVSARIEERYGVPFLFGFRWAPDMPEDGYPVEP